MVMTTVSTMTIMGTMATDGMVRTAGELGRS